MAEQDIFKNTIIGDILRPRLLMVAKRIRKQISDDDIVRFFKTNQPSLFVDNVTGIFNYAVMTNAWKIFLKTEQINA
jgi:hypothetical protein